MREFKEGNALTVTARFREQGEAITPSTVHYKLVNLSSRATLVDWTSVAPADTVEIQLAAQLIKVQNEGNRYEIQEVSVVADKDLPEQCVDVQRWKVKNLNALN